MPIKIFASDSLLKVGGIVDVYYQHEFNRNRSHERPLGYAYNRSREVALNLGAVNVNYDHSRARASLGLATGTYMKANYASEPSEFRNIFRGYAGVRIGKVWLDAGVFPSHIGTESDISTLCWTYTRSLSAENSPYFETGARATYEASEKLTLTGLVLNGWQNIKETNNSKAFGTQIQYKITKKILVNSSTFFGNEKTRNPRWRYFHDFYLTWDINDRLGIALLYDYGAEKNNTAGFSKWQTGNIQIRQYFSEKICATLRGEFFEDKDQVIVSIPYRKGPSLWGASVNVDYHFSDKIVMRAEMREIVSDKKLFPHKNTSFKDDLFFTVGIVAVL